MFEESQFTAPDGTERYACHWLPEKEPQAELLLLHGYGEYCGRYGRVAQAFNDSGIAVHSYDQYGFGRSPGRRGYVADFDALLRDLDAFFEYARPRLNERPLFLMGHSMGGMAAVRYVQTRQPALGGLVCSSPFLALPEDTPDWLLSVAQVLSRIAPWLPVGGVDNSGLSRDPAVVEAADNDPLNFHGWVKARTGAQFHETIQRIEADYGKVTLPVHILHGTGDTIVPCAGSQKLYDNIPADDKTLKLFEGGYHELWNDLCKDEAIGSMRDWVRAHC